jgi:hypothetical protein
MKFRIFFVLLLFFAGCDKPVYNKPKKLISEKKMIDMLVDIHLAEAMSQNMQFKVEEMKKLKTQDYYYSILKKYNVADSTFEKSLVFYGGMPKEFEKMYSKVLDRLHLLEQKYIEKGNAPVNVGNK